MSSVSASGRQRSSDGGYYIPLANIVGKVYAYTPVDGQASFTPATWASLGYGRYTSSLSTAGAGVLRDMGKTVVSASRTFRKVQLVVSSYSTFGVAGAQGTTPNEDYLSGYVELGFEGPGSFTPLAHYGR